MDAPQRNQLYVFFFCLYRGESAFRHLRRCLRVRGWGNYSPDPLNLNPVPLALDLSGTARRHYIMGGAECVKHTPLFVHYLSSWALDSCCSARHTLCSSETIRVTAVTTARQFSVAPHIFETMLSGLVSTPHVASMWFLGVAKRGQANSTCSAVSSAPIHTGQVGLLACPNLCK